MYFKFRPTGSRAVGSLAAVTLITGAAFADGAAAEPFVDFGNTAWVLMSAAMVLFMTAPALALFYGGLVKRKNVLSVLMQCFIVLAVISIQWVTFGYSLAFGPGKGTLAPFIGSFDWALIAATSGRQE